jgi:hypothetical protein
VFRKNIEPPPIAAIPIEAPMPLYTPGSYDTAQAQRVKTPEVQHSRLIYLDALEELDNFCRFVPPVAAHLDVYSTKLWSLLLRTSAEVSSQLHALIEELEGPHGDTNIAMYRAREHTYQLAKFKLVTRFDGRELIPFEAFAVNQSPPWWRDYNAIKHRRLSSLESATLNNAIHAVGGLFVVLYRQWGEYLLPRTLTMVEGQRVLRPPSEFFSIVASPWS